MPSGYTPKLLEATEEALDEMALAISISIVDALLTPRFARMDHGLRTGSLDASNEGARVIEFLLDTAISRPEIDR